MCTIVLILHVHTFRRVRVDKGDVVNSLMVVIKGSNIIINFLCPWSVTNVIVGRLELRHGP